MCLLRSAPTRRPGDHEGEEVVRHGSRASTGGGVRPPLPHRLALSRPTLRGLPAPRRRDRWSSLPFDALSVPLWWVGCHGCPPYLPPPPPANRRCVLSALVGRPHLSAPSEWGVHPAPPRLLWSLPCCSSSYGATSTSSRIPRGACSPSRLYLTLHDPSTPPLPWGDVLLQSLRGLFLSRAPRPAQ